MRILIFSAASDRERNTHIYLNYFIELIYSNIINYLLTLLYDIFVFIYISPFFHINERYEQCLHGNNCRKRSNWRRRKVKQHQVVEWEMIQMTSFKYIQYTSHKHIFIGLEFDFFNCPESLSLSLWDFEFCYVAWIKMRNAGPVPGLILILRRLTPSS